MKIYADIQRLYVGELIDLFELDCTEFGGPLLRFHGYTQVGPIFWRGNEFTPYTLKTEGLETTGEGAPPTPTLYVGNIGQDAEGNELPGYVSGLCLLYQNLYKARLRIYRTLGRYLDAENFPEGNPEADPTQALAPEQWFINQKVSENPELVTFSLSSVLDAENRKIPNLDVQVSVCQWTTKGGGYRGAYCGYAGAEMFDKDDQPTADPAKDYCPGLLQSCQIRRGGFPGNAINIMAVPAADRIRG